MKKLFEGTDPLTHAKNDVLSRMPGCSDEVCHACDGNKKAVEDLARIAYEEGRARGHDEAAGGARC